MKVCLTFEIAHVPTQCESLNEDVCEWWTVLISGLIVYTCVNGIIIIKVFYRITSFVIDLTFNRISVHIEKCVFFSKVWTLVVEFLFDVCEYVLICIFSLVKNPSTLVFCCPLCPVELIPVKFEGWINHSKQSQCVCCRWCQSVHNYHTLSHSPWR